MILSDIYFAYSSFFFSTSAYYFFKSSSSFSISFIFYIYFSIISFLSFSAYSYASFFYYTSLIYSYFISSYLFCSAIFYCLCCSSRYFFILFSSSFIILASSKSLVSPNIDFNEVMSFAVVVSILYSFSSFLISFLVSTCLFCFEPVYTCWTGFYFDNFFGASRSGTVIDVVSISKVFSSFFGATFFSIFFTGKGI